MQALVDVSQLRLATLQGIARGNQAQELARKQAQEAADAARLEQEAKAKGIIRQIPSRCQVEAAEGRSHAIIMSVGYNDTKRPQTANDWRVVDPAWLTGAAQIVWQACVDAKLQPTLEFWHDGVGVNSGHNIVVHW